ncbi:methyltransferase [Kitasatospora herbaricolor]|uniref:class I SAM-dependent methyltransferase n=1 Tax=Kitasatospora herbaricolor TaxID=68217 RepID=UPI00174987D0|nr:methyltransferase domain-containing protein [Kitasatospora herbaricolor]MDQ0311647.1 SAM-dependent methyltransferase [Kitasatospora herbaricolor]GGU95756.1 methyltransferase [Kitasatospora herbaricolor]
MPERTDRSTPTDAADPGPAARPAPAGQDPATAAHRAELARTREFFGARAAGWDAKFPDDGPRYAAAVAELGLRPGQRVLDAGCGTGRALPALRAAVGPDGAVTGVDVTPEMLAEAEAHRAQATLLLADCADLPLPDAAFDAVFAAGLVSHLPAPALALRELARVTRPGGLLALFHPVGRAALAARHGRQITPDDLRAEPNLRPLLAAAGWELASYADEDERYLALSRRTG